MDRRKSEGVIVLGHFPSVWCFVQVGTKNISQALFIAGFNLFSYMFYVSQIFTRKIELLMGVLLKLHIICEHAEISSRSCRTMAEI